MHAKLHLFLMSLIYNIFLADKCKIKVLEKANKVLKLINDYMKCNLLHINIKKCCYMHFTSNRKEVAEDDDMLNLILGQNIIKCVKETKFLVVIIDDKLSWGLGCPYKIP